MKREAARVVRDGLLALRHDPYMMHQANLNVEAGSKCAAWRRGGGRGAPRQWLVDPTRAEGRGGGGRARWRTKDDARRSLTPARRPPNLPRPSPRQSLVQRWLTAVLDLFHSLVNWPVVSRSLDELYADFKDREARDACALSYKLRIGPNGAVKQVTISSGGAAGCTAPLTAPPGTTASSGTWSRIGNDAPLLAVPLAGGGSATLDVTGLTWSVPGASSAPAGRRRRRMMQ
jgi:hypothetical protein